MAEPGWRRTANLIQRVCELAAPRRYVRNQRRSAQSDGLAAAVANHDSPALYYWLMDVFKYQGIADKIATAYCDRHGRVRWSDFAAAPATVAPCPKLSNYWTYHGCGFRKNARSCALPRNLTDCIVAGLPSRNGNLAQTAAALFLFLRDVCEGDLITWIDGLLSASDQNNAELIISRMSHIYGVSDKVLSLALAELLLAGRPGDEIWLAAGARLIVVDTLVHNWLHRSGILRELKAEHSYGPKCYKSGGCAELLGRTAQVIDARRYSPENPKFFPRLVQLAIWRFCAAEAFNICNGNRIDDREPCTGQGCPIADGCERVRLRAERTET